jgi:hypothetical protein
MRLYALGDEYPLTVTIENTGDMRSSSLTSYTVQVEETDNQLRLYNQAKNNDGYTISGTLDLAVGAKKEIPVLVSCLGIDNPEEITKKLNVLITDIENEQTWNDVVSVKLNAEPKNFFISSRNSVRGVVITPNAKAYYFRTVNKAQNLYQSEFDLPYSSRDYLIIFSGATADTESPYSLSVGTDAITDFSGANVMAENTEDNAVLIGQGGTILSYLYGGALHYYRINLANATGE